jgi:hypothetical protein
VARCRDRFGRSGARCGDATRARPNKMGGSAVRDGTKAQNQTDEKFGRHLNGKRIVCLDIPDRYGFMDPELVALLQKKVGAFMR